MSRKIEQHTHPQHPRLYVQLRSDSKWFQAIAFVDGRKQQWSTRTQHLPTAFRLAEDWYRRVLRVAAGEEKQKDDPLKIPLVEEIYKQWLKEVRGSKRQWAEWTWGPIAAFWGALRVSEISSQTFREFYRWRRTGTTAPKNSTVHQGVVLVRQLLRHALEEQHIVALPAVPNLGKIEPNPRPWLTRAEWDHLSAVSLDRIGKAKKNPKLQKQRQELDNQMVWMVGTMMRVDEAFPASAFASPVRFRDCRITKNSDGEEILLCEVKGKRGVRTVVGRREARDIFKAYKQKGLTGGKADQPIFPVHHREAFTELLKAADLHIDPVSGFTRNFKSLRCTAISFAVLQGVDLMWIARNAGTSIVMLDNFYCRRLSAVMAKDQLTRPWKD